MSSADDLAVIALGYDLLAEKRYWIAVTALWAYEYLLTVGDEIEYLWKARKNNVVFWLFFLNRYLTLIIIAVTCVAFFASSWTEEVFSSMQGSHSWHTKLISCRVYALSGQNRIAIYCAVPLMLSQAAMLLYVCSQSANGTANLTLLLGVTDVTSLPDIDAFRLCISVPPMDVLPYGQAFLCLLIVYDGLAVVAISYIVAQQSGVLHLMPILKLIQRDGLLYFAVISGCSSYIITLRFIAERPAMVISSIVVSRITINLKKASHEKTAVSWRTRVSKSSSRGTSDRSGQTDYELSQFNARNVNSEISF
ncbi:hypothetical protein F5878DRAFT_643530 [Lentinula raphanica]|uniref:DUF6533 domain-containing protein n=1 Tax=Lentinula raphanica TaxID=153919 RepID=A0AA38UCF6_9AGAR|nr:hypothetical protein F5878DRAFT_643530 [Lentinula raphanica]